MSDFGFNLVAARSTGNGNHTIRVFGFENAKLCWSCQTNLLLAVRHCGNYGRPVAAVGKSQIGTFKTKNVCPQLKAFLPFSLTSVSAGSPGLFRHTWAPDNSSPSRLESIHVGVLKKRIVGDVCWWLLGEKCCWPDCWWGGWTCGAFRCGQKYHNLRGKRTWASSRGE